MKTRATLVVRRVMQNMGYTGIYTNRYKTMRTVKCYGRSQQLEDTLKITLFALGIIPQIRRTVRGGGTIVQLPL